MDNQEAFNVVLERTVRGVGEPCLDLEEFAPAKQEIVCSRSFGERVTEYGADASAICSYAARGAEKTWRAPYCCFISASVKTLLCALNEPYYGNSASVKPLHSDSRDIINAAVKCRQNLAGWSMVPESRHYVGDFFSCKCPAQPVRMRRRRGPEVKS